MPQVAAAQYKGLFAVRIMHRVQSNLPMHCHRSSIIYAEVPLTAWVCSQSPPIFGYRWQISSTARLQPNGPSPPPPPYPPGYSQCCRQRTPGYRQRMPGAPSTFFPGSSIQLPPLLSWDFSTVSRDVHTVLQLLLQLLGVARRCPEVFPAFTPAYILYIQK